jgi:hypothetical protein
VDPGLDRTGRPGPHRHTEQEVITMSRSTLVATAGASSALALAGLLALAPVAGADPVNRNTSPASVTCEDGTSYLVTAVDNTSQWSAAHDLTSNATLIPTAWGTAHIELRNPDDGSLIDAFDQDWGGTKGASSHSATTACVVSITSTEDIPDLGSVLVSVTIPVTLHVTR